MGRRKRINMNVCQLEIFYAVSCEPVVGCRWDRDSVCMLNNAVVLECYTPG